jgi:hypothetical protein
MNFADVFKQGSRLGMFSAPAQPGAVNIETIPGFSSLSKEDQNSLRKRAVESQFETQTLTGALSPYLGQNYTLDQIGQFREQEARRAQKLGKESVETAAKYSMLTGLPKTIAQSFGNMAAMNLYAGQAVSDTFAKTLANYPRAQFASYQFQPEKYFG